MKYGRFEETPVWKSAVELAVGVFRLVEDRSLSGVGDLRNQMQRAALSISNNIAEGFERGTTAELITFLYYARGSAGEVRSMLAVMERMSRFAHLKSEISSLKSLAESIGRQLRGWAGSLQNSEIKGQKYLTDAVRAKEDRARRQREFLARLDEIVKGARKGDGAAP